MIYKDYFKHADFEEIWHTLAECYNEPESLKPLYHKTVDSIIELPVTDEHSDDTIKMTYMLDSMPYIHEVPDPQEWLVGREVDLEPSVEPGWRHPTDEEIAAHLLYWSTLYSFETHGQEVQGMIDWFENLEKCRPIRREKMPEGESESFDRKALRFWSYRIGRDSAIDWSYSLRILRRKLEYNIGYWRLVQRHVGWQDDVKRMQTCCNLLDIAATDYSDFDGYVNPANARRYGVELRLDDEFREYELKNLRREKAYQLVWKYLSHNMKDWWD